MHVLMTGATGLIGRELGKALVARGDTITCLVRDAVVNLAGEPVADTRWTESKKALILDSRVQGTRRLVEAVLEHGPRVGAFVQGSASGFHGDRGSERLDASRA